MCSKCGCGYLCACYALPCIGQTALSTSGIAMAFSKRRSTSQGMYAAVQCIALRTRAMYTASACSGHVSHISSPSLCVFVNSFCHPLSRFTGIVWQWTGVKMEVCSPSFTTNQVCACTGPCVCVCRAYGWARVCSVRGGFWSLWVAAGTRPCALAVVVRRLYIQERALLPTLATAGSTHSLSHADAVPTRNLPGV